MKLEIHKVEIKKGSKLETIGKMFAEAIEQLETEEQAQPKIKAKSLADQMTNHASITNCSQHTPPEQQIKFGDIVSDTVTGFKGQVTALAQYATCSNQIYVQPKIDYESKWVDGKWFDIDRIKIIPTGGSIKSSTLQMAQPPL